MRGAEARANAVRVALAGYPRIGEMTELELCRLHRRMVGNVDPQPALPIAQMVTRAGRRARSRR